MPRVRTMCSVCIIQVFTATLGPQHIRTLVAARNEQHIKHKIIKLPAQPQEHLTANTAGAGAAAINNASAGELTASGRRSRLAQQGSSSARGGSSDLGGKARGAAAARLSTGSDSDSWDSSSGDERQAQAAMKDSANSSKDNRQMRSGRRSDRRSAQGSSAGGLSLQHNGSMQERLAAVRQARQVQEEANQGQQQLDTRDYTDPDHLGAGVFRATSEQQQLYMAFMADVKAHAQGASSSSYTLEPGLLELQVLRPKPPAVAVAAVRGSSACGGDGGAFGGASVVSVGVERLGL